LMCRPQCYSTCAECSTQVVFSQHICMPISPLLWLYQRSNCLQTEQKSDLYDNDGSDLTTRTDSSLIILPTDKRKWWQRVCVSLAPPNEPVPPRTLSLAPPHLDPRPPMYAMCVPCQPALPHLRPLPCTTTPRPKASDGMLTMRVPRHLTIDRPPTAYLPRACHVI
jgi:hypothetical protein